MSKSEAIARVASHARSRSRLLTKAQNRELIASPVESWYKFPFIQPTSDEHPALIEAFEVLIRS